MRHQLLTLACAASLVLSACDAPPSNRELTGGVIGAAGGLLLASAFDANPGWTILTTLAGAAAGTLVARNTATNQCAYAVGDGTYRSVPC
ncbi:glycine zipper 2TM domain-containing protein [uncultured Roseovarius sp.]|uniref:glycine zipper 2TM domain-containing protein n=1 Tax=Roseovarius sp. TaxID=1486281 RepID=UPI0025E0136F|nr:glycine zipper 2TM domain-containing protein [uncultured Roseovarius sp.]